MELLRNLPTDEARALKDLIALRPGCVASRALSRSEHCQMTLLAFDAGESVSEESYFGDTLYLVLEGQMPLTMDGRTFLLSAGDCLSVPANTLHAIGGTAAFKLLQITLS